VARGAVGGRERSAPAFVIVYADREMLKWIRLVDFKSFVDEEVELAPVTVLVGANASGKSNLLDALWFLHGIVLHLPVDVVLDGEEEPRRNGEPWPGIRGGSAEASRLGSSGFELDSVWSRLTAGAEEIDGDVLYGVSCQTAPQPRLIADPSTVPSSVAASPSTKGPSSAGSAISPTSTRWWNAKASPSSSPPAGWRWQAALGSETGSRVGDAGAGKPLARASSSLSGARRARAAARRPALSLESGHRSAWSLVSG